jgi:hypothetical protein
MYKKKLNMSRLKLKAKIKRLNIRKKRSKTKLHLIQYYLDSYIIWKYKTKIKIVNNKHLNVLPLYKIDLRIHSLESISSKTIKTLQLNITLRQVY